MRKAFSTDRATLWHGDCAHIDLFAGSGTTGLAALAEGLRFVGVEREAEFVDVAAGRLAHVECVPVPELTQDGAPKAAPAQPSLFDAIGGAR